MNFSFLKSNAARILTGILALQGVVLLSYSRPESVPPSRPLADFPRQIANWTLNSESAMDKETAEVLQADDTLNRNYVLGNEAIANLFVAAFRSQRNGKAPHSPKNCLPGAGWVQQEVSIEHLPQADGKMLEVNRYIVGKANARSLVYYWYQSRDRSVANEYRAKAFVVLDAIQLNRTDTALVRVVMGMPVTDNARDAEAIRVATDKYAHDFIAKVYPNLREFLPQ